MKLVMEEYGGRTLEIPIKPGIEQMQQFEAELGAMAARLGLGIIVHGRDPEAVVLTDVINVGDGGYDGRCEWRGEILNFRFRPAMTNVLFPGISQALPTVRDVHGELFPVAPNPGHRPGEGITGIAVVPVGEYWSTVSEAGEMILHFVEVTEDDQSGWLKGMNRTHSKVRVGYPDKDYRSLLANTHTPLPDWLRTGIKTFVEEGRDILTPPKMAPVTP
jgi:hypothetical protein